MGYDIIVLGDLVADILLPIDRLPIMVGDHPQADGLFVELGGSGNTIVAARRLGLSTTVLAAVGGDSYGDQLRQMIADEGADTSHIFTFHGRATPAAVIISDRAGQHVFVSLFKWGPPYTAAPDHWPEVIRQARSLFSNGWSFNELVRPEDQLTMMRVAREAGVPTFFDLGPRVTSLERALVEEVLQVSDVFFATADEARHLIDEADPGTLARAMHSLGPRVTVIKVGAEGCFVSADGELVHHSGFPIEVVDTVGAGDAFAPGFIAAALRGGSWREAAALGNAMGAITATVRGGGRNIPSLETAIRLLGDDPATRLTAT